MKSFIVVSFLLALGGLYLSMSPQTGDYNDLFEKFIHDYGMNYVDQGELDFRRQIFENNMIEAEKLNILNPEAEFGVTSFADQTKDEMLMRMGAIDDAPQDPNVEVFDEESDSLGDINWMSVMQPVQNQGTCGSCWAFSAVATFEGRHKIMRPQEQHLKFSEQQVLDCTSPNYGCGGGWYDAAWVYLSKLGLCELSHYRYTGVKWNCRAGTCKRWAKDKGFKYIAKSEPAMHAALKDGPISTALDASNWHLYKKGIITRQGCYTGMTHAITIVGYDSSTNAWNVKNSWGTGWGEQGYVRLAYGQNTCNLLYKPEFPVF